MIISPLLVSLDVIPSVSSSTGMYLVIYSSGASSILYIIDRLLLLEYALGFGVASIIGTIIGIIITNLIVKKTGRQSFLVLILAILMFAAMVIIPIN